MVQVNSGDTKEIRANARSANTTVRVSASTNNSNNPVGATNSMAEYYAEQARQSAEAAAIIVDNAIEDIQNQENSSIENIKSYTSSSLGSLQEKYDELKEGLITTYVHEQAEGSDIWYINHNLGKKPSIMVVDSADTVIEGAEKYIDENNIEIHFNCEVKGKAYLN